MSRILSFLTRTYIIDKLIPIHWSGLFDNSWKYHLASFKLFNCNHCQVFWFSSFILYFILPYFGLNELSLNEVLLYSIINYNLSKAN